MPSPTTSAPSFKAVLIDHNYSTTQYEREIIEAAGGVFIDGEQHPLDETLALCRDAEGILCRRLQVTPEMIQTFKKCKILVRYGIGTDNINVDAATAAGIIVGHIPDYCLDEVSVHAIGLLLACVRRIITIHEKVRRGGWDVHREEPVWRMQGRTLGLIGLGKIGQAVARKMQGWGLRLLAADPYQNPSVAASLGVDLVDLDRLCRESDYVSVHVPLLPETHHLLGAREFGLMRPEAIVVNTARGPVLDTQALLEALNQRKIGQAALDVFEEEPLPLDSPMRSHPKMIVTDHTAWYSEESQIQLQKSAAREIARVCTGGLPNSLANPEVLEKLGRYREWEPSPSVRWQLTRLERMRNKTAP